MAFVINTNIMSINAQRNLMMTQQPLSQAMQRLSSGFRINSAADDAAGLAIATRMDSQTRGLNVAIRDANDGLSMVQTAEGSLGQITSDLQRMRELSVQAMSGQYGASDIGSMQMEINALVEDIGRIAEQTTFNNKQLLAGTFQSSLAVSYNATDSQIHINLASANTDSLGGEIFTSTGKNGEFLYLRDLHTASSTGVQGVGDGTWVTGAGAPYAYSYTSRSAITYSGRSSLLINDSTTVSGFASRASNAIAIIDGALAKVTSERAGMGAKANQLNAVIFNLANVVETTMAARSRIMDADFAAETANMTKSMILQQSGISVLSQANTTPQNALALLK
ncbi:flagellin [Candidatus Magnetominusculus xianensis]|uniref:Flagellin n=1 Tax=Candidatus Magnetominusculus xianensis TaxID=1748249 RepID=A0ABR5SE57_9BACT|nr:flagellin [Candidatus Magnetominusculus xianensis]KWT84071.1 putative flagellin [Candidatus Magnetominusculus xianensis]MBF0402364.1 flagellin FliC [Nitrospirota bacterium]